MRPQPCQPTLVRATRLRLKSLAFWFIAARRAIALLTVAGKGGMMRRIAFGVSAAALMAAVSACVPSDVQDPYQRAVVGAALGAALGTGVGATFAINPGVGSVVGAETGAALGAVAGAITAEPPPSYGSIPPGDAAFIPGFYDTWPPGYHPPPIGSETPRPPPRPI